MAATVSIHSDSGETSSIDSVRMIHASYFRPNKWSLWVEIPHGIAFFQRIECLDAEQKGTSPSAPSIRVHRADSNATRSSLPHWYPALMAPMSSLSVSFSERPYTLSDIAHGHPPDSQEMIGFSPLGTSTPQRVAILVFRKHDLSFVSIPGKSRAPASVSIHLLPPRTE
ncbi:hypothetical protein BJ165DRAFT_1522865 [Panaeolus papilionaceus]|nr:hypothetical protein BJ165DRAFT_1522865 [Panaeolus papilionaceus]